MISVTEAIMIADFITGLLRDVETADKIIEMFKRERAEIIAEDMRRFAEGGQSAHNENAVEDQQ